MKKMMDMESCVPPGFRFHPTEEELVGYYLKRKMDDLKIDLNVIIEVDLYKIEPWDIQDRCKLGYDEQNEWYFFSHKDRKYPTGTRTNRATAAGFWKATGRDKAVLSKEKIIGMRKTLVFYKGRAPNGRKTDWIMHEYRLQTSDHGPPQEEGWVVCRAFKKPNPSHKQGYEAWNYMRSNMGGYRPQSYPNMPNFDPNQNLDGHMPKLDSPSMSTTSFATNNDSGFTNEEDIKSSFGSSFDYKLLGSTHQLMGTASFDYTNMPLIPHGNSGKVKRKREELVKNNIDQSYLAAFAHWSCDVG
ncbi:hypothetical protein SASPL_100897 [Salvia splendens]|uniref:NAC domain-containing protein n=1 Tax=Salvia splendens TaxID=180675 RepID=A0A8X9ACX0_SALSN|nr:hypothetical protein SASPL_100897 [Salvia splendens]